MMNSNVLHSWLESGVAAGGAFEAFVLHNTDPLYGKTHDEVAVLGQFGHLPPAARMQLANSIFAANDRLHSASNNGTGTSVSVVFCNASERYDAKLVATAANALVLAPKKHIKICEATALLYRNGGRPRTSSGVTHSLVDPNDGSSVAWITTGWALHPFVYSVKIAPPGQDAIAECVGWSECSMDIEIDQGNAVRVVDENEALSAVDVSTNVLSEDENSVFLMVTIKDNPNPNYPSP